ncbi:MAG: RNA polymerase sigma factor [Oscillospiraceae bacterium]
MKENRAAPLSAEELVEKYSGMIYRLAYSRLRSEADAEDITQEVLIKYIRADMTFNDEEHRRKWLLRVTVNAVKSMATTAWRRHTTALEEAEEIPYSDEKPLGVREAVEQLPEKYRIPIHLFYFEDLPIKQIAEIMGAGEGTIKSLLSRGRTKLKELLGEDEYV